MYYIVRVTKMHILAKYVTGILRVCYGYPTGWVRNDLEMGSEMV